MKHLAEVLWRTCSFQMSRQRDFSFTQGSCLTLDEGLKHVQDASVVDLEEEEADLLGQLEDRHLYIIGYRLG